MERALAETNRRREKQIAYNIEHGITPQTVKKNVEDILAGLYKGDVDMNRVTAKIDKPLAGANLKAVLDGLRADMRKAAENLEFEEAARLRDEVKRLKAVELDMMDDPMARNAGIENTKASRKAAATGKPMRGPSKEPNPDILRNRESSYFQKPTLDNMGPGTDMEKPAGYFRKNDLDEMTVGRTEKPVPGKTPQKPDDPIVKRGKVGAGSYEDPAEAARNKRRPGKTGRPGR